MFGPSATTSSTSVTSSSTGAMTSTVEQLTRNGRVTGLDCRLRGDHEFASLVEVQIAAQENALVLECRRHSQAPFFAPLARLDMPSIDRAANNSSLGTWWVGGCFLSGCLDDCRSDQHSGATARTSRRSSSDDAARYPQGEP